MQDNNWGTGDLYLNSTNPINKDDISKIPQKFFNIKLFSIKNILKTKKIKIILGKTAYLPPTKFGVKAPAMANIDIKINDIKIKFNKKSFFLKI